MLGQQSRCRPGEQGAVRRNTQHWHRHVSNESRGPSRVLKAIGATDAAAFDSIRFGLGKSNTAEHISLLINDLTRVVRKLREISAA